MKSKGRQTASLSTAACARVLWAFIVRRIVQEPAFAPEETAGISPDGHSDQLIAKGSFDLRFLGWTRLLFVRGVFNVRSKGVCQSRFRLEAKAERVVLFLLPAAAGS